MAKKPPPILIFAVFSFWVALPVFAQSEESASPPPRQTHDDHDRATGPVFRSFPRDSTIMVRSYMPPELDPRHRYPDARPVRDLPGGGKAGTGNSRGRVMTWNLVTGEVSESEEVSLPDLQEILMVPGQAGVLQAPSGGDRDPGKDFNGWYLVEDPTTWEYPRRVKMWMSFRDQSNQVWEFVGSGSLIDPMHVLTAAHCVYAHEDLSEGWSIFDGAEAVTISPGYEVGISPWGLAEAVELHVWSAWIDDEDSNFDLAIVDLDRPVGILTGCYGFGYHPDCDYFLHGVWDLAGYPIWSDPPGELMYEAVGNYDWCSWLMGGGNLVTFDSSAGQGLSGSGSVRDGIIWAVHVARNEYESLDCAICNGIFQDSEGILLADRPTSPDLWPLQVQVEPYLVDPGDQLSSFSFVLGNYSRVGYTGNVICKIYLSADNVITEDDIWLDYVNVEANIPPGTGQSVAIQPPTIPVTTDPGQWFLGLIITLEDADQGNNVTGVFDQGVINVHCPYVPMTVITAPANGEVCQPTSRTIDWNDVPNADIYELVIGPGCDVGLTVPTSVSQYTVTGLNHGQTYFVKVRTHSICGEVSAWSPCIHFTTEYIPSPYFTFTDPPEGDFCQDADSVTVRWDPMPRAYMYQIQLGETCGSGLVSSVHAPVTEYTFTALQDSATYHYRARTLDECGNWGEWSECGSFTTLPTIYPVPAGPSPADGFACAGAGVDLAWEPVGFPCSYYEVEWGRTCRMDTMTVTHTAALDLPTMGEGLWYWHVRAAHICGGISSWSPCWSFNVDVTPPEWPEGISSSTHDVGVWSGDNQVTTNWPAAVDGPCQVAYRVVWNHDPNTIPGTQATLVGDCQYQSCPLPDGNDQWFHVLAQDQAGNPAVDPRHLGPFWIDATPPEVHVINPVGGQSLVSGQQVTVSWTGTDPASGVAGAELHYTIDAGASWQPMATIADPLVTTFDWTVPAAETDSARVRVTVLDAVGNAGSATNERWFSIGSATGSGVEPGVAARFALAGNYPNPFNPMTTIRYAVPRTGRVRLAIYDPQGRRVCTLCDGVVEGPAWHEVRWDGINSSGRRVSSGVYFCRLEAEHFSETIRMVLIR